MVECPLCFHAILGGLSSNLARKLPVSNQVIEKLIVENAIRSVERLLSVERLYIRRARIQKQDNAAKQKFPDHVYVYLQIQDEAFSETDVT